MGGRGGSTWTPVQSAVNALNAAFCVSFEGTAPTNTYWLLALNVSSSITSGQTAGIPGLTPTMPTLMSNVAVA